MALLLACRTSGLLMSGQPVTPQGSGERPSGGGSSCWSRGRANTSKMIHRQHFPLTPWSTGLILGAQAGSGISTTPSADPTSTTKELPPMRGGSGRSAPQEEPHPSQIKKWGKTGLRRALHPHFQLLPHHKGKKMLISDIFMGCNFHKHSFDFNISFSKGAWMGGNHLRNTGPVVYCLH